MNKKEIAEIRKELIPDGAAITRIRGCLIDNKDNGKKVKTLQKHEFAALSEEDVFKYEDIFKATLSGTLGKNLLNLGFSHEEEKAGGKAEFLRNLCECELKDDGLMEEFFDRIKNNFAYEMSYYIVVMHCTYDIPGKSSDGSEMFDASDNVFNFIIASICPMELTESALSFDSKNDLITARIRDWFVDKPVNGFMFPAFNDRSADVHQLLYYSKNGESIQPSLIDALVGSDTPLTAKNQKEAFNTIIKETLGEDCNYDSVISINETLNEAIAANKDEEGPVLLNKSDVKQLLSKSGVAPENLEVFDSKCDEVIPGDMPMVATNVANTKKWNIETPSVVINVPPEKAGIIEKKKVDGRECLVIPIDGQIKINGVDVAP
jgi:hypothetical protein